MAQTGGGEPRLEGQDTDQGDTRNRGLTDPYANFETEEPEVTYTDYLCNKKPTVWQARVLIMFIFFVAGATQSYQSVIILELQEKGATYSDQAKFSIVNYPYLFKILFAPLLDVYYIRWMGKCKTYIVISLTLLGLGFVCLSHYMHDFNVPSNINMIVAVWTLLNFLASFSLIGGEMLILKAFNNDDEKAKGGMLFEVGFATGTFLAMNALITLSDLKWLNSKRAPDNQLTHPYMTHAGMLYGLGTVLILFSITMFVFFGEKQIEGPDQSHKLLTIFKSIPRFFTTKNMRDFMLFMWITKAPRFMITEATLLKLIDAGLSKTELVNVETVTFPLYVLCSGLIFSWITKQNPARMYLWMVVGTVLLLAYKFFLYLDLKHNHNPDRTINLTYVAVLVGYFINTQGLGMACTNKISQPEFGSSFLTIVFSWWNSASIIPTTIGLKVTSWVGVDGFPWFFWFVVLGNIAICVGYYKYAVKLDTMTKEE